MAGIPEMKKHLTDILPLFWDLASINEASRRKAVLHLIKRLQESQELGQAIFSEKLNYTVRRLVKGLSSSRKGARQGFSTALSQVLEEFQEISPEHVFNLMNEHLTVKGNCKSQEERDVYFGQVFCYLAVFQSTLKRIPDQEKGVASFSDIVKALCTLQMKKSYLKELCAKSVVDILENVDEQHFEENIFHQIQETLNKGWDSCTPEDLLIVLAVQRLFQKKLGKKFFRHAWKHSNVCDPKNNPSLANVLTESTNTAHPRMHSVWKEVIPLIFEHDNIQAFWSNVIEDNLMQSSHERKFLVFKVLQDVLPVVNAEQASVVFSENLVRCIINSCSSEKNYLYSATKDLLSSLPDKVKSNQNTGVSFAILQQLIGGHGTFQFDSVTKTKTIEKLTELLDNENLQKYIKILKMAFLQGKVDADQVEENEMKIESCRKWVSNQLFILVRNAKQPKEDNWMIEIAEFLFLFGHFRSLKKKKHHRQLSAIPEPPVSAEVKTLCQNRFIGVLDALSSLHYQEDANSENHRSHGIPGTSKTGEFYAYYIVNFAKEMIEIPKYVQLEKPWVPEVFETFTLTVGLVEQIRSETLRNSTMSEDRAFELLFLHTTLQLFGKPKEVLDIIEELHQCYKKVKEKKKTKKSDEEEPHWSEVLTEILLSFLTQPSHLMRQVVDLAFAMIVPHLTPTALNLIIEAVKPKKSPGEDDLEIEEDSDEMDTDDDADTANENDKQVEEESEEQDDEEGTDDESEDSGNEDVDVNGVDETFRAAVKSALGDASSAAMQVDEKEEESEAEDDGIDMDTVDPEYLNAMDKALSAAFKGRIKTKKQKQEEKKAIAHFHLRVLDVIEIFIRKEPTNILVLNILEPLLEVVKQTEGSKDDLTLHERAQGLFKNKLCRLREYPSGTDIDKEEIHIKLERLITQSHSASSVQFVVLITHGCMYLIRVLRGSEEIKNESPLKTRHQRKREAELEDITVSSNEHIGQLDVPRLVTLFKSALSDFMLRRNSHLQPVLFLELIKRFPVVAWKLADDLPSYFTAAVNNFRKVQACEMALHLLSRKESDFEDIFPDLVDPFQKGLAKVFQLAFEEECPLRSRHFNVIIKLTDKFLKEARKHSKVSFTTLKPLHDDIKKAMQGPVINRSPQLLAFCKKLLPDDYSEIHPPSKKQKIVKSSTVKPDTESVTEPENDELNKEDTADNPTNRKIKKKKKKHI